MQSQVDRSQMRTAFILSTVSGALIILQGALHIIRNQWALELGLGELRRRSLGGIDFKVLGAVTIVLGAMVLLGALLIRKSGREREGGITVLAFSLLTIFAGGGYLAGLILGAIGGAIALSSYQPRSNNKPEQK